MTDTSDIFLYSESVPRNPVIARAYRFLGWAEFAGSGSNKDGHWEVMKDKK